MKDNELEQLLGKYRLPRVPPELDRKILGDATLALSRRELNSHLIGILAHFLNLTGFGYLNLLLNGIFHKPVEYRITL